MLLFHSICEDCAGKNPKVLRDLMPVWFFCCWCGLNTYGQLLEADKAPCEDTCLPIWDERRLYPEAPVVV